MKEVSLSKEEIKALVDKHYNGKYLFTNDCVFQQTMIRATQGLIDFLNAFLVKCDLVKKVNLIKKVTIKNEYSLEKIVKGNKGCRLDIKAETDSEIFNIEMQVEKDPNMINRMTYYSSRLNSIGLKESQIYSKTKNIISIVIADFNLYKGDDLPYYIAENEEKIVYKKDDRSTAKDLEDITYKRKLIIVQLPKFRKYCGRIRN